MKQTMKLICTLAAVALLAGCGSFSMLPDSSSTKLKKSPCACVFEAINGNQT